MRSATSTRFRGDGGTSLVLAIVFIFAIGLVLVAIGGLAAGALKNTSNVANLRSGEANAESAATVAIRYVETSYTSAVYSGTATSCLPVSPLDGDVVKCVGSSTPTASTSRLVDFYACSSSQASTCVAGSSSVILHAQVAYGDWNFAGQNTCSATGTLSTCGDRMTIVSWDVLHADT